MIANSLLRDLLQDLPHLRPQMYFKSSLTALSHAMEDIVLAGSDAPLVIANFQQERFYHSEIRRYQQIAERTDQIYILAAPEAESGLALASEPYNTIPLDANDGLAQEWHLIIVGENYNACLVCREEVDSSASMDQTRRFEGIWTFDSQVSQTAARLLLGRIAIYRPELAPQIEEAWQRYRLTADVPSPGLIPTSAAIDTGIFAQRLVTYLQSSQYKLLKTYRVIATQERKERLINMIATAMRRSLNPEEVLAIAVQELGQIFPRCRCLLYCFQLSKKQSIIEYESVPTEMSSLKGQCWSVSDDPLFVVAQSQDRAITINDITETPYYQENAVLKLKIEKAGIRSWLLAPIRYQGTLVGMLELHDGGTEPYQWREDDITLVEAIAIQAGAALSQAQAYTDMTTLNRQLKALERTQSSLIAIVGHELRTPLSTIRVCLESLVTEPDMAIDYRQSMLEMALEDSERMRRLVQDFLTLSKLESGDVYRCPEPMQLTEALEFALSCLRTTWREKPLPYIDIDLSPQLPLVCADGEGLVEVFTKLLDNACKFTDSAGKIIVRAKILASEVIANRSDMLEVIITDTGRGIEPSQLETIFDRFHQAEDWLRRSVGGTGLGLAICRQIIQGMGGQIWAFSEGCDRGSQFHFTVPIEA